MHFENYLNCLVFKQEIPYLLKNNKKEIEFELSTRLNENHFERE